MGEPENATSTVPNQVNQLENDSTDREKTNQERSNIVSKYAKGTGGDDDSENLGPAEFIDQYGFVLSIHNQYTCKSEPVPLPKQEEDKRMSNEVKRGTKWLKMVRHWDKYAGTEKLAKRVYKGIPQSMRGDVWKLLLQVDQYMENMPQVYKEMKTRAHHHSNDIRQIDLDVNRTYRDHEMFRKRYSIKQQELFHVLAAYSMYNTEVGYCQGMSQIAALLLMYMSEEEAFWALHSLLYGERHKMHGFFIPGFPKLIRFQDHHDRVFRKLMPKLKKHFDDNEVFASLYTMKWFFQCFLDRSPFSLTLRLWDIYILEGERLLLSMSYTTLKVHKAYLKSQDMDGIVSFLQEQLVKDFGFSDDDVVLHLKNCMADLRRNSMDVPPKPSEEEKPKLPFGSFIPSTEKSAQAKVPEFAKHAVDIETLIPDFKRKGSLKKKRDKVKRGKSGVGRSPNINGIDHSNQLTVKDNKSMKHSEQNSRSPFLMGSKRFGKTERTKPSKSPAVGKKTPSSSAKHEENKPGKKNKRSSESAASSTSEHRVVGTPSQKLGLSSTSSSDNHESKPNGKIADRLSSGEHSPRPSKPSLTIPIEKSSDHKNNSNNVRSNGKRGRTANGHHPEPFIPAILTKTVSSSSYETHSSDQASPNVKVSNSSSPKTVAPVWNKPSSKNRPPKNSFNTLQPKRDKYDTTDSNSAATETPLASFSQTMSRHKSHSSDYLKASSSQPLKSKTPSFSQLSAALDTIENASQLNSPVLSSPSESGSYRTSPIHKAATVRPVSIYDNVKYDENMDFTSPTSGQSQNSYKVNGMEDSSRTTYKSNAKGGRRKKMGKKERSSRSMGDLRDWKGDDKKKKGIRHTDDRSNNDNNNENTNNNSSRPRSRIGSITPSSQSAASPFQRAVLETGILNPPNKTLKGRRMSREEIVTAAILSQMESKNRKPYSGRKSQRTISENATFREFKKSKSAASLSQRPPPTARTRKGSADFEQVLIPQTNSEIQSHRQANLMKSLPKRKNSSLDNLDRSYEKSWNTTELDNHEITSKSYSLEDLDPSPIQMAHPVHNMPYIPPSHHQPSSTYGTAHSSKFSNQDYSSPGNQPMGQRLIDTPFTASHPPIFHYSAKSANTQINELLSSGINADPNILNKYNESSPFATQHSNPYATNRRQSVNMAVQTEESRVA